MRRLEGEVESWSECETSNLGVSFVVHDLQIPPTSQLQSLFKASLGS